MTRFWTTADLKAGGSTDRRIAGDVRRGDLEPVRPGWFARPGTDRQLVRAVRVGGVATAHTAARARGLWTPPDIGVSPFRRREPLEPPVLRVAVARTTARAKLHDPDDGTSPRGDRADVVLSWVDPSIVRIGRRVGAVSVLVMLRDVFRAEPPERALAVLDSALRHRHLRRSDLPALAALLPAHLAPVVGQADGRSQSGTESIARYFLRLAGLSVEPQAAIAGVGHVDLLVEGRVIVELDGREWHDDAEAFAEDRRRDLVSASGRYVTLRFTWFRVLFRWNEVEAAVFAALAA